MSTWLVLYYIIINVYVALLLVMISFVVVILYRYLLDGIPLFVYGTLKPLSKTEIQLK